MAYLKGTNVAALIVPFTDQDTYATHDAKYGKGGFRSVQTVTERNAIPNERKDIGMIVHISSTNINYIWTGTTWNEWIPKGTITVDTTLSTTSTNPVQNKIVTAEFNKYTELTDFHNLETDVTTNHNDIVSLQSAVAAIPRITVDSALSITSTNPVQNKTITTRIRAVEATANTASGVASAAIPKSYIDTTIVSNPTDTRVPSTKAVSDSLTVVAAAAANALDKANTANTQANDAYTVAMAAIPKANIDTEIPDSTASASDTGVPSTKAVTTLGITFTTLLQLVQDNVNLAQETANNAIPKSKIDTSIAGTETDNTTVPGVKAMIDFVKAEDSKLDGRISSAGTRIGALESWKNTIGTKGAANGVAGLDASGKVPAAQLPSYVDDVVDVTNFVTANPTSGMTVGNVYYNSTTKKLFTATSATTGVTSAPESDKIYVRLTNSTLWRWSGSTMAQVNGGLVLGTTSTTAGRGDWVNTLYTNFGSGTNLTGTQDARNFFSKAKTYTPLESQSVIQSLSVNLQSNYVKIQDNILYLTGEPNSGDGFEIPAATSSKAGVMTAEMYKTLQEIELATFPLSLTASGGGTWEVGSSTTSGIAISVIRKGVNVTADSTIKVTASSGSGSLSSNKSTWTPSASITSNTSVAVKATYGSQTAAKTVSYAFKYKKYWGTSASATLTNANILALTGSTWADSIAMNATNFDCTGGKYPYYVIPAALYYSTGNVEWWVGGLKNTDLVVSDITLTNASGASAAYKVIRLANKQTGVLSIQFK